MNFKKLMGSVIIAFSLLLVNVGASELVLYNEEGAPKVNGDKLCANKTYKIDSNKDYKEILIIDEETNFILDVLNANTNIVEVVFPKSAGKIKIVSRNFTSDNTIDADSFDTSSYVVEDCGYSKIEEDYNHNLPKTKFTLSEGVLKVTLPEVDGFKFSYQFVGKNGKTLNDDSEIQLGEETILQFIEEYSIDGKAKKFYYEIEIDHDDNYFFIREVDTFDLKVLKAGEIFNFKLMVIMLILAITILVLNFKKKKLRKEYRNLKIDKLRRSKKWFIYFLV